MRFLVLGGGEELRRRVERAGGATALSRLDDWDYDLAAILSGAGAAEGILRCGTLLLWEEMAEEWLGRVRAEQVVSCGLSPQNTLTPASMERPGCVVTVQRELRRPDGRYIWPQDVPLPPEWAALPLPQQLILTGLRLLGAPV